MKKRIAIFGGSFNPPGVHHRQIALALIRNGKFHQIHVVPCGPRPDKRTTNDITAIHRAVMVDLTFGDLLKVRVDLFDLEQDTFTRTHDLETRYGDSGSTEVWHVVGPDLIAGGRESSFIIRSWFEGVRLWEQSNFVIIMPKGTKPNKSDLPPHSMIIWLSHPGRSTQIREQAFRHESITDLVVPAVANYIERHHLYHGAADSRVLELHHSPRRIWLRIDRKNPQALSMAEAFRPFVVQHRPELIVVIGGDGTMLQAIRHDWRKRIPFYGINAGHRGFLLNPIPTGSDILPPLDAKAYHLPLLYVEQTDLTNTVHTSLAFNDAWMERASGQTGWYQVSINGRVQLQRVMADGMLVCTAAGSAAYARAMGAVPLAPSTPSLCLVGSNVLEPPQWRMANLQESDVVVIESLCPTKRPVNSYVDGFGPLPTRKLTVRTSRIAAVELVLNPSYSFSDKMAAIQFPAG